MTVSNKENTRHLFINAEKGWIHYWDEKAIVVKGSVVGVPTTAQSESLALGIFDRLGLPRSELANKPDGTNYLAFEDERTLTRFDRQQAKEVTTTSGRGAYFVRQIDGIPMAGIGMGGGFHAKFGNDAAISEIEVVWRKLQRYKHCPAPSTDAISGWIRDGKAVMTHGTAAGLGGVTLDSGLVKTLTVTNMVLLYTSAGGNEVQDFIYPFLKLAAIADCKGTNSFVLLYCPILSETLAQ